MGKYQPVSQLHWTIAAEAVKSNLTSSSPLSELEGDYKKSAGCSDEVFTSSSRRGDIIPYRDGFSFLTHRLFGVPPQNVQPHIAAFTDAKSIAYACRTFETECRNRGISFPENPSTPYSLRLVKNVLSNMDLESIPKEELLQEYSRAIDVDIDSITSPASYRPPFIADVRGGFFYAAAVNTKMIRYITKDPQYGMLFQYWRFLASCGFESVPNKFREEIRRVQRLFSTRNFKNVLKLEDRSSVGSISIAAG